MVCILLWAQLPAGLLGETRVSVYVPEDLTVKREGWVRQRVGPQNRPLNENHEISLYTCTAHKANPTFCVGKDVGHLELTHCW